MNLDVRSRDKSHKVNRGTLEAAGTLFGKLERYLPDPGWLDVQLEHIHSKRKGKTHYVHATAAIPGEPATFHVEAVADDFRSACDQVFDKLERQLRRRHKRLIERGRSRERKDKVDQWVRSTLSAPGRLLGRMRRGPHQT